MCLGFRRTSIAASEGCAADGREELPGRCAAAAAAAAAVAAIAALTLTAVPLDWKGGGRGSCRSRSSGLISLSSSFRFAGVEARSGRIADAGGGASRSGLPCTSLICCCCDCDCDCGCMALGCNWRGSRGSNSTGSPEGPEREAWDRRPALEGRLGAGVLGLILMLRSRSLFWDKELRCGSAGWGWPGGWS